ncbi:MAG TPA: hypothetical protein VLS89_05380, partial [Candidatus Nanopelagicales bacterium]|nr:hypothetical protein [Candidatus Nanopelagicales bacterium]
VRTEGGEARLFDGGIDWSGTYWPDARVLDGDGDGQVTTGEYAQALHLVSSTDQAALAMGWAYSPGTLTTAAGYEETPPFSAGHAAMMAAGFSAESAVIWGAYNTLFDALKALNPIYQGVGYYNVTSASFRAELLGHTAAETAPYTSVPAAPDQEPPLYAWLASTPDAGWTAESVEWALRNANTGVFSAPLFTLHGDRDGFLGLGAHALGYRDAVEAVGDPMLHRLYVIQNGTHVDRHADGVLDYDFDGQAGEEGAGALLTPMQGYVKRAFGYLVAWTEVGASPPESGTVVTDPANDTLDPIEFTF